MSRMRYVRRRSLEKLRYSDIFIRFLSEAALARGVTVDAVFSDFLSGKTFKEVTQNSGPELSSIQAVAGVGTINVSVTTDTAGVALVLSVTPTDPAVSVTILSGAVIAGENVFSEITGLSAGTYAVTVTQGSSSATVNVTVASASGTATVTLIDFTRDYTVFDGDMARGNNFGTVGLYGTTDAADGEVIQARAVLATNQSESRLVRGRANNTVAAVNNVIENNVASFVNDWVPGDKRTAAQWAADNGLSISNNSAGLYVRITSGTYTATGVDFGDTGFRVQGTGQLFIEDSKTAFLWADGGTIVARDVRLIPDTIDPALAGSHSQAISCEEGGVMRIDGFVIAGQYCDTLKTMGDCHLRHGFVSASLNKPKPAVVYDPNATYQAGDVIQLLSGPSNKWWRVLQTVTGIAPPTQEDYEFSNEYFAFMDFHNDGDQLRNGGMDAKVEYVVWDYRVSERLVGPTAEGTEPGVNVWLYYEGKEGTRPTGNLRYSGHRVYSDNSEVELFSLSNLITGATLQIDNQDWRLTGYTPNSVSAYTTWNNLTFNGAAYTATGGTQDTDLTAPVFEDGLSEITMPMTAWADVGVAADGAWAGTLPVGVKKAWLLPEVRVSGSSAEPDRGANRFGVGLALLFFEQSNMVRGLYETGDAPGQVIGNNGNNFQVHTFSQNSRGLPPEEDLASEQAYGRHFVTDSNPITDGRQWMAAMWHKNAPGIKVTAAFDVKPGRGMGVALNVGNIERKYESTQLLLDLALSEPGQELGIFDYSHFNDLGEDPELITRRFLATTMAGDPITFSSNEANWTQVIPTLSTGRTQVLFTCLGEMWNAQIDSADTNDSAVRRDALLKAATAYPNNFQMAMELPTAPLHNNDQSNDPPFLDNQNHFNVHHPRGFGAPSNFAAHAVYAMYGAKLLPNLTTIPRMKVRSVEPTGAWIEFEEAGGRPITTMAHQEALAGGTDPVVVPAFGDLTGATRQGAGEQQVAGFTYLDADGVTTIVPNRTEIVDADGNAASSGFVRIYKNSGSWAFNDNVRYAAANLGSPYTSVNTSYHPEGPVWRFVPLVDAGLEGNIFEHGVWVNPPARADGLGIDRQFINRELAAGLPASAGVILNTTAPGYNFQQYRDDNAPAGRSNFVLEFRYTNPGNDLTIWGTPRNGTVYADGEYNPPACLVKTFVSGDIRTELHNTTDFQFFGQGTGSLDAALQAPIPIGTAVTVRVAYNKAAATVTVSIDGVEHYQWAVNGAADLRANGSPSWLIPPADANNTVNDKFNGTIEYIRLWWNADGSGTPRQAVEAENGALVYYLNGVAQT